jgi:hypothetical protein
MTAAFVTAAVHNRGNSSPASGSPDSPLKSGRTVEVEARTLDSFEFDFVGLIKLDIQGAEYPALIGARETILRHRPVLLIEEKPFNAQSTAFVQKASDLLISYGLTPKEKAQETESIFSMNKERRCGAVLGR